MSSDTWQPQVGDRVVRTNVKLQDFLSIYEGLEGTVKSVGDYTEVLWDYLNFIESYVLNSLKIQPLDIQPDADEWVDEYEIQL